MILKIKNPHMVSLRETSVGHMECDMPWRIIDNIKSIDFRTERNLDINKYSDNMMVDYIVPDSNTNPSTYIYAVCTLEVLGSDRKYCVLFQEGYLCGDDGRTLERLNVN